MRNFSDKTLKKIKTHIFSSIIFIILLQNPAVYMIKSKSAIEPGRPQTILWRMRIACWIPKAANTLSEYVILVAFHHKNSCTNASGYYFILYCLSCSDHERRHVSSKVHIFRFLILQNVNNCKIFLN